jgi:hypothetical protein
MQDLPVLLRLLQAGQIKPVVGARYPLLEAARANALLESGQVAGNIALLAPELLPVKTAPHSGANGCEAWNLCIQNSIGNDFIHWAGGGIAAAGHRPGDHCAAVALGLRPANVQEYYALYQSDRLALLLRDDFTSLLLVALYLFTIPALYIALRRIDAAATALASLFVLVAVVTCFATNSGFSMLYLSQQYAAAPRRELLAAGEAVLAADMWHSSGAYLAGILMQGGGMFLSLVMLRSRDFAKATAYSGLLGNGLD